MIHTTQVLDFKVAIYRKSIKNIYVRVDVRDGSVKVSAPKRMSLAAVKAYVVECERWIRTQQANQLQHAATRPYTSLLDGERIPLWGELYPLEIRERARTSCVMLEDDRVVILQRGEGGSTSRLRVLDQWYREHLMKLATELIRQWEPIIQVSVHAITVRKMKTLWGSCNIRRGRICLNRELVKLHPDCLESVIVHEMTHLHEPKHNQRFYQLMTRYLPDWRVRDARLHAGIKALGGLWGHD